MKASTIYLLSGLLAILSVQHVSAADNFRVKNHSPHSRNEFVNVNMPFEKGRFRNLNELQNLKPAGSQMAEWSVVKWHYENGVRHSIAIARLTSLLELAPNQERVVELVQGSVSQPGMQLFHPDVVSWLQAGGVDKDLFLHARFPNDSNDYVAVLDSHLELITDRNFIKRFRIRTHFKNARTQEQHPLSMTVYFSLVPSRADGEMIFVVGNDTLENAVGLIQFEQLNLFTRHPFRFEFLDRTAYGISNTPQTQFGYDKVTLLQNSGLGDGQTMAFRGRWGVIEHAGTPEEIAFLDNARFPLTGIADFNAWKVSESAGPMGYLFDPRFSSLSVGRATIADQCGQAINAGPYDELGVLNSEPFMTGDQPDFTSNVPVIFLKTVQTMSDCLVKRGLLGADREALRPSFYYMQDSSGKERRITSLDFPNLFFWSGRPHWHPSWNPEYPEWQTRTGSFEAQTQGRWAGMDNQHYGNNHLRVFAWELLGDEFSKELLVYHQTIVTFNHLTKYFNSTDAERAYRLMKEALLLYMVEDDTPVAQRMLDLTVRKNRETYLPHIQSWMNQYGKPTVSPVFDDCRVTIACQNPGEPIAMAWQSGFNMEYHAIAMKNGFGAETSRQIVNYYFDEISNYFDPSGSPITYFMLSNPSIQQVGGIGQGWWAGWINAAKYNPSHPAAQFIEDYVKSQIREQISPRFGEYWTSNDKWRSFQ